MLSASSSLQMIITATEEDRNSDHWNQTLWNAYQERVALKPVKRIKGLSWFMFYFENNCYFFLLMANQMHYVITYLFYKHIIFYIESNLTGCLNNKLISNYEPRGFPVPCPKRGTGMEQWCSPAASCLPVFFVCFVCTAEKIYTKMTLLRTHGGAGNLGV